MEGHRSFLMVLFHALRYFLNFRYHLEVGLMVANCSYFQDLLIQEEDLSNFTTAELDQIKVYFVKEQISVCKLGDVAHFKMAL